jgi:hypothetical protein
VLFGFLGPKLGDLVNDGLGMQGVQLKKLLTGFMGLAQL